MKRNGLVNQDTITEESIMRARERSLWEYAFREWKLEIKVTKKRALKSKDFIVKIEDLMRAHRSQSFLRKLLIANYL